jgi:hypothetical protein
MRSDFEWRNVALRHIFVEFHKLIRIHAAFGAHQTLRGVG